MPVESGQPVTDLAPEQIAETFSESALEELTDEQVSELIDTIDPEQLTEEQAEALSAALSDAPDDVKQEFEAQINVFGGQFDSYVPTGSTISVGERRVVVAATAAVFAAPAATPSARRK